MKNLKLTLAALTLASLSFGSFAADLVQSQPGDQQKVGVITVSGASDLTSLESSLAAKADQAGAKPSASSALAVTTSCTALQKSINNNVLSQQIACSFAHNARA